MKALVLTEIRQKRWKLQEVPKPTLTDTGDDYSCRGEWNLQKRLAFYDGRLELDWPSRRNYRMYLDMNFPE